MANNSDTLNSNVGDNKAQYVSSLSFQKVDIEHNDCVKTNSDDTNTQEGGLAYVSDPVAERKLLRKLDLWILPVLCLIYFIASMDRGDIGNAQVAGMQADLHISNTNWPQVTSMFYIGYIVCQPLGTFLLRKLTPPVILGCAVTFWGTVTVLLLTVKTYQQAIGLRVLIGAAEGFVQAAPFYMSIWYKQYELGFRGGVVFSVSTLAGAFNGLISYGVTLNYSDKPPFRPWQWLFLIEGCLSIGVGIFAFLVLPPVPERVKFGFTAKEKAIAIQRSIEAYNKLDAKVNMKKILPNFKKPIVLGFMVTYACLNFTLGSLSSFMPSMIKGMGYTSVNAQLMSVPVYFIAFVSTITFGILSDKFKKRGIFLLGLMSTILIGFIIIVACQLSQVRYAGVCIAAFGLYPCIAIFLAWINNNVIGYTQKATVLASTNMFAQVFAIVANSLFTDPPYYLKGTSANIGVLAVGILAVAFTMFWIRRVNKFKLQNANSEGAKVLRDLSMEDVGTDHPDFYHAM